MNLKSNPQKTADLEIMSVISELHNNLCASSFFPLNMDRTTHYDLLDIFSLFNHI